MEAPVTIRGIAKSLGQRADVIGYTHKGTGATTTIHKSNLRVDQTDVVFHGAANVADGDHVVVFGSSKNGVFQARALLNLASKASYPASPATPRLFSVLCWGWVGLLILAWLWVSSAAFAIPFLMFGLPVLILGLSFGSEARYLDQVNELLSKELRQGA